MIPPPAVAEILRLHWGFDCVRPLQREAMDAVLARRDSLLVLPTGGGKSLCFQAPALVGDGREGVALVVSPLIALMKDQVDGLVASGVSAARLDSAMTASERDATLAALDARRCSLLYVSPERLVGEGGTGFQSRLARWGVRYIAVDEAHCISHWGHDFRPEYRRLGSLRDVFPAASMHAFTATATRRVRDDIVRELGLREPQVFVGDFDRPNLVYRVRPRLSLAEQLAALLEAHRGQAGIVYCIARKDVDRIAAALQSAGWRARPYHAGLSDEERARNQDDFINERVDVIVATVAFGMGVDRSDVRFVVHAGAPKSLEHYQQEAGRAGRDGLEADCVLLYSAADFLKWRRIMEMNGELTDAAIAHLREMERYAIVTSCRHRALVEHFGQPFARANCGACDWCLRELEQVEDAVVLGQKIGSCVARLKSRWGIAHVTAVLEGKRTAQVTSQGHDALSTFGLLSASSTSEIRAYIEQLISQDFLTRTMGDYPVLQLTARGLRLLRGQIHTGEIVLCRPPRITKKGGAGVARSRIERESWEGVDRELFDELRRVRLDLARDRGVPPYVVFHDSTLRELARRRPASLAQLLDVPGVGSAKAQSFGSIFLDAIAAYDRASGADGR
jgi:ATP-dependent DNA helicase RecQ